MSSSAPCAPSNRMRLPARRARIEQLPGDVDEGQDLRRNLGELGEQLLLGELRLAEAAAQRVVVHEDAVDLGAERRRVAQVLHADGAAADLVLVGGADAAAGGADLAGAGGFLADDVELAVQRQDERGVLGDAQVLAADRDALARRAFRSPEHSAHGSTTTPLPMTPSLPGRTTPDGSSDSLKVLSPMTSVWPALWPPWKRTTMSARSDSQSTTLPLPSSPHWAPTTATFAI